MRYCKKQAIMIVQIGGAVILSVYHGRFAMTNVSTRPKFGIPAFALLIVMLAISLLPVSAVHAGTGGNADIGGTVYGSKYYYYSARRINTPLTSGPDVAALKYAGPAAMKLGVHNCSAAPLYVSLSINTGAYTGIAPHLGTSVGQVFCLYTEPTGSTGTFTANLD